MRKYVCDNCGREFGTLTQHSGGVSVDGVGVANLWVLTFYPANLPYSESYIFGEYCVKCKEKIEKRIKEGIN